MITNKIKMYQTDNINETFLNETEVLNHIGFPLQDYEKEIKEYGEYIVADTILDELVGRAYWKSVLKKPFRPTKKYRIITHILEDYNHTDRGVENCSTVLGYTVEEAR